MKSYGIMILHCFKSFFYLCLFNFFFTSLLLHDEAPSCVSQLVAGYLSSSINNPAGNNAGAGKCLDLRKLLNQCTITFMFELELRIRSRPSTNKQR